MLTKIEAAYIFDFVGKSVNVLDRLWDIVFILKYMED